MKLKSDKMRRIFHLRGSKFKQNIQRTEAINSFQSRISREFQESCSAMVVFQIQFIYEWRPWVSYFKFEGIKGDFWNERVHWFF